MNDEYIVMAKRAEQASGGVADAFDRLIAAADNSTRVLRNFGLTVNVDNALREKVMRYNWSHKSRKMSVRRIPRRMKQQAFLDAVLNQG